MCAPSDFPPYQTTTPAGARLDWTRDEHGNLRLADFSMPLDILDTSPDPDSGIATCDLCGLATDHRHAPDCYLPADPHGQGDLEHLFDPDASGICRTCGLPFGLDISED